MADYYDKKFKRIFKSKNLTLEEKVNKCSEYIGLKIKEQIDYKELLRFIKETGIVPIKENNK